ncbi:MAG: YiiX family permuted papain-like enzyme [Bacteroidetes bacterium]|nr:YiiX family permuted papain-like enzyme [Bacteroidota bacterium]
MKPNRIISIAFVVAAVIFLGYFAKRKFYDSYAKVRQADKEIAELVKKDDIKNGDIIFQSSISAQCEAIRLATHSEYTHCGIIFKNGNDINVYEAVQPVKVTPLDKWIARGQEGHFVIKRLTDRDKILNESVVTNMISEAELMKGKDYDIYFGWSDEKIYCSELIWKIYKRAANIEVGKLQILRDFDLTSKPVKKIMDERYGLNVPYEETVISPASIFDCTLLTTVYSNKKK